MRLFVAVLLSDHVRAVLKDVQARLEEAGPGVRWVPPELLHLTVKFLGEVPDPKAGAVAETVARGAAGAAPFTMQISGCGCFPPRGPVRIVWTGASDASGTLVECVEAVNSELERFGFPRERRPWSPHITIGRVREDRSQGRIRSAVEALSFDAVEQPVKAVTLMSSVLSPKGPTYTAVSTTDFGSVDGTANKGS